MRISSSSTGRTPSFPPYYLLRNRHIEDDGKMSYLSRFCHPFPFIGEDNAEGPYIGPWISIGLIVQNICRPSFSESYTLYNIWTWLLLPIPERA